MKNLKIQTLKSGRPVISDDEYVYVGFRPHLDRFSLTNEDDVVKLRKLGFMAKESLDGKSWELWVPWTKEQLEKRQSGKKETYTVGK